MALFRFISVPANRTLTLFSLLIRSSESLIPCYYWQYANKLKSQRIDASASDVTSPHLSKIIPSNNKLVKDTMTE